ncbi:MAG: PIG-L deacetylase family protein [Symbiobacteriia bacterium]
MLRLTNPRQKIAAVLGLLAALLLVAAGYRYFFPTPARIALPAELSLDPTDTVLVVAPHSDDETLGAGGLIERAVAAGAGVHVVLLTNGDGFTIGAEQEYHRVHTTPADYIRLAHERQRETLAALESLGVPAQDVTFLGYPDRGLAPMWLTNWLPSNLYFSRFTGADHSPYSNSLTPGAPYCGQSLAQDLRQVLLQTQPTVLVVPHPNDVHPDHWAAYNFVTYTLAELKAQSYPFASPARVYYYLVHRGDWPAPKGLHLASELVPPGPLIGTDTHWFRFDLDPRGAWAKYQAILKYKSQVALMRRYLESFARKNDLFGTLPSKSVPLVAVGSLVTGSAEPEWERLAPLVEDPVADTLTRQLEGSADLKTLRVATDGTTLFLRLEARQPVSPRVRYVLHLRPLRQVMLAPGAADVPASPGPPAPGSRATVIRGPDVDLTLIPGALPAVVGLPAGAAAHLRQATANGALEISLPLADLGYPQEIFFGAESHLVVTVDRMAWALAPLPPTAVRPPPAIPAQH